VQVSRAEAATEVEDVHGPFLVLDNRNENSKLCVTDVLAGYASARAIRRERL
jgi:hypothetical protein